MTENEDKKKETCDTRTDNTETKADRKKLR